MSEPYTRAAMVSVPAELVEALRSTLAQWRTDKPTRALVRSVESLLEAAQPKCEKCGIGTLSDSGGRTPLKCIRASCNHVAGEPFERPTAGEGEATFDVRISNESDPAPAGEPCVCGHDRQWHPTGLVAIPVSAEWDECPGCLICDHRYPHDHNECPTSAPLSPSVRRTRDEGSEDEAKAFKRGWIDSAVHHATCNGCGTGPLRHDIPDYRPRAARLAGEDDR